MRRSALLALAVLATAGCGGAGAGGGSTTAGASAAQLGSLSARAQEALASLDDDLVAVSASGAATADALALRRNATSDAVGRLRALASDVERGADAADAQTRPAFLALDRATTAYLGVLQDLAVHQGSSADLARYLCRLPARRDAAAGVRAAVTAFDADARAVRERTGVPVTQFGGDHAQSLNDAYVTATDAAGCLASAVHVLGGGVLASVSGHARPGATAASGAREVAALAGVVSDMLRGGPPDGVRTGIARLWSATLAAARIEGEVWTARAAAYARGRKPAVAALLARERAAAAVWLAASDAA